MLLLAKLFKKRYQLSFNSMSHMDTCPVFKIRLWPLSKRWAHRKAKLYRGGRRFAIMAKNYEKEFKIEAVRLASERGNTQAGIERDLGIG